MGFSRLNASSAGMKRKRLLSFVIDTVIVLFLSCACYNLTGRPDFFSVKAAMDAAEAAGRQDAELLNKVYSEFGQAWSMVLTIALCYEIITQLLTNGSTIGKLIMGLQTVPLNPDRNHFLHALLLCVRSVVKMASIYICQGIPFLICCLTIFTNSEYRTGFDIAIKSVTVSRRTHDSH